MKSSTESLIKALRILAVDIQSEDGVANACIAEAAERLHELELQRGELLGELVDLLNVAYKHPYVNKELANGSLKAMQVISRFSTKDYICDSKTQLFSAALELLNVLERIIADDRAALDPDDYMDAKKAIAKAKGEE